MGCLSSVTLTGDDFDGCDGLNPIYSIFAGATWLMLIVYRKVQEMIIDFLKTFQKVVTAVTLITDAGFTRHTTHHTSLISYDL